MTENTERRHAVTAQDVAYHYGYQAIFEPAKAFKSGQLQALLEIWRRKCAERTLPRRSDFSMRDIARWIRNIAFVDIRVGQRPVRYRYMPRFMGEAIMEVKGDLKGKFIDQDSSKSYRDVLTALYDEVRVLGIPMRYYGPVPHEALSFRRCETMIAPISDEGPVPNMLMVANYSTGSATSGQLPIT